MRHTSRLLPPALLVLASLPVHAVDTPSTENWVVTSAKATGAHGEEFVTSLRIVNGGSATATATVKLLAQTPLDSSGNALTDNTGGPTATVTVGAGQTLQIDDVLGTKFSAGGAAGLLVTSDQPVVVLSQTLVANARSATGTPGTYGFAIPAQTLTNAVAKGETAWVPYVSGTPDSATTGYRTNLFLLSGNSSTPTTVHVRLVRGDGSVVGEHDYQLGKLSQTQVNRIAAAFGSQAPDTNMTAVVTVTAGGPVFLGASVIDNATSSILYTPPAKLWRPQNASYGLNVDDGGYGFSGRLNVDAGIPEFLSLSLVLDTAPGSGACSATAPKLFFVQAASYLPYQNTTFVPTGDGGFSFTGAVTGATFTGVMTFGPDGTVSGQVVYTRASTVGNDCAGVAKTFPFFGSLF